MTECTELYFRASLPLPPGGAEPWAQRSSFVFILHVSFPLHVLPHDVDDLWADSHLVLNITRYSNTLHSSSFLQLSVLANRVPVYSLFPFGSGIMDAGAMGGLFAFSVCDFPPFYLVLDHYQMVDQGHVFSYVFVPVRLSANLVLLFDQHCSFLLFIIVGSCPFFLEPQLANRSCIPTEKKCFALIWVSAGPTEKMVSRTAAAVNLVLAISDFISILRLHCVALAEVGRGRGIYHSFRGRAKGKEEKKHIWHGRFRGGSMEGTPDGSNVSKCASEPSIQPTAPFSYFFSLALFFSSAYTSSSCVFRAEDSSPPSYPDYELFIHTYIHTCWP